ncbi:MAG: hypothetical protein WCH34_05240 [Bacteroidota bacterium]
MKFFNNGAQLCYAPPCPCDVPFGVYVNFPFEPSNVPLTPTEFNAGYGKAMINIDNQNKVHLIFDRRAALDDNSIPISVDFFIGSAVSNALGYDSIIIQQGTYNVNF